MKLGSLFDGIGGFPLSATRHGIEPVWASEIEPFPIRVTKERFPDMVHLGDITKINGAEIEPVDIVTFGSPCQDLSVAGKRAGMQHESKGDEQTTRSGLFMEAVRIIKEMRSATGIRDTNDGCAELDAGKAAGDTSGKSRNGVCGNSGGEDGTTRDGATGPIRPRFAVWENVPGAYSSNKGEDFRIVLEELCRVVEPSASIPEPAKGKWLNDGAIVGDGWSIAWRTLDAQHWGVPQRRRRIYLVADFAGQSAPQVLFEREGLRRDSAESGEAREGVAADATGGVDGAVGFPNIGNCLKAKANLSFRDDSDNLAVCVPINTQVATRWNKMGKGTGMGIASDGDPAYTLQAGHEHAVAVGVGESPNVAHCLRAGASKADKHESTTYVVSGGFRCGNSPQAHSVGFEVERSPTIPAEAGGNKACVVYEPLMIEMTSTKNTVIDTGVSPTLTARMGTGGNQVNAVMEHFRKSRQAQSVDDCETWVTDDVTNTVNCFDVGDVRSTDIVMAHGQANAEIVKDGCPALTCNHEQPILFPSNRMRVRRLTALECERLQGYPDGWTDIEKASDSARYKALGNSLAIPNAEFVIEGIVEVFQRRISFEMDILPVPNECYEEYGGDLDGCSSQENGQCGWCVLRKKHRATTAQ